MEAAACQGDVWGQKQGKKKLITPIEPNINGLCVELNSEAHLLCKY